MLDFGQEVMQSPQSEQVKPARLLTMSSFCSAPYLQTLKHAMQSTQVVSILILNGETFPKMFASSPSGHRAVQLTMSPDRLEKAIIIIIERTPKDTPSAVAVPIGTPVNLSRAAAPPITNRDRILNHEKIAGFSSGFFLLEECRTNGQRVKNAEASTSQEMGGQNENAC
jgi:hypothetical protein